MHTITTLEDRLADDTLGCVRRELRHTLEAAITELSRQQREPQPVARYSALGRQRQSCLAALQVIDTVWHRCHQIGVQFRP
ncbi:EscE/YscE/SsaE family type III secretion system needle protein co-chaperone [Burkholderia lata]|uniref:EscE/YscE/SsaE family type III secretion system needle protein co-chaperone n=1 Tax=Burkholderia lata (strain ATCC 17760 / DSM 23089 / LMG 22485 / NCIMB 9086 / R18194 / 383) TaxID=482957 RepID=UPI001584444E